VERLQHPNNLCIFSAMKNKKSAIKKLTAKTPLPQAEVGRGPYTFFQDVYEVVRQVPKGKVTSYGAIANYLGTKLSARMVGWAMNAAGSAKPKVPAQRVVNRNGMLTGKYHFSTPTLMEELLKKDGVKVEKDTVVDFKQRFWDPATALSL
jgi:methylated-DNA-protein-cysteine methyltransferase related protein